MKCLIVKAILGFGDRLEFLKMCVSYALKNDIKLIIDWSDPVWGESFQKYFSLDIPTMSLDDIQETDTVYPEYWKGRLKEQFTVETANARTDLKTDLLIEVLPYDIVVVICTGKRTTYDNSYFFASKFRVIDERIITEVQNRRKTYDLSKKWGIHLRGTDRASSIAYKQKRLSELTVKLVTQGLFNGASLIVVSDDKDYIDMWKTRFPEHPVITSLTGHTGTIGTHMILNSVKSKDQLNVELLIDFFTLASCARVYSTSPDSRFAKEAIRLAPFVNNILSLS
jgi:hypothetical protein